MRILVVEDDYLLAQSLCLEIDAHGDEVIGPFSAVPDALDHLEQAQAAILDVELRGRTSFTLADRLERWQVPFVFLTGHDKEVVPPRFARSCVFTKPSLGSLLLGDLHERRRLRRPVRKAVNDPEMVVREMMVLARRQMPDAGSADRLVEAALLRTIAETADQRLEGDIRGRLFAAMEEEFRQRGRSLLQ